MSLSNPKPTHHTEDWSRSSFFDVESEMVKALHLESDDESDNESHLELDATFHSVNGNDINAEISDNPIMNEIMQYMIERFTKLIETGELPLTFMDKMRSNPEEILAFIQENHTTIGNELNDKLDPEIRPNLQHMIQSGIIPNKYYPFIKVNDMNSKPKPSQNMDIEPPKKHSDLDDAVKTEEIMMNTDGEKTKDLTDTGSNRSNHSNRSNRSASPTEAAYIEKLRDSLIMKDEKIEELMAEIAALKQREKQRETPKVEMVDFAVSHTTFCVEDEMRSKHVGEIKAVKNEYNELLDDMQRKNKDLEQKHLDSMKALQDIERSKVELLRQFNGEMDRMRAEIKKYNTFKMMTRRKLNR